MLTSSHENKMVMPAAASKQLDADYWRTERAGVLRDISACSNREQLAELKRLLAEVDAMIEAETKKNSDR